MPYSLPCSMSPPQAILLLQPCYTATGSTSHGVTLTAMLAGCAFAKTARHAVATACHGDERHPLHRLGHMAMHPSSKLELKYYLGVSSAPLSYCWTL